MSSLVGHEQGKAIVEKYDKKFFLFYVFYVSLSKMKGVLLIKGLRRIVVWISLR
jgi:hypothetical protein